MLDGHQGDGLVRGGGPAEKLDEHAALAGILIRQCRQHAAVLEDPLHVVEIAVLGQQLLPGVLAEAAHQVVEVRIVERPGDGVGGDPEHADRIARHLPVAEMSRDEQQRPAAQKRIDDGRRRCRSG